MENPLVSIALAIGDYGGWLGSLNSVLIWLLMLGIGVFALYFAVKIFTKQDNMIMSIVVALLMFGAGYFIYMIDTYGWVLYGLYMLVYIAVIYFVFCNTKQYGWGTAFVIWLLTIVLSVGVSFVVNVILTMINEWLGLYGTWTMYLLLAVVLVVTIYIFYWVITKALGSSRKYQKYV